MLTARLRARLAIMEEGDLHEVRRMRSVRRRLFHDDIDPEKTNQPTRDNENNRIMEETRENLLKAKERWNFDFEKEEPLPGRYQWVKPNEEFPDDTEKSNNVITTTTTRSNAPTTSEIADNCSSNTGD